MLQNRLIPSLLLKNNGFVKTTKFKNPIYIGDPINTLKIFNTKEVDEIMVLDIEATRLNRNPNYDLIEQFASECFIPLCYGGGIKNIEQASILFKLGVEKISVQTSALEDLGLIRKLSERFGSQSIIVSIDIKKDWLNRPQVYIASKNKNTNLNWISYAKQAVEAGAGEILLNSVDNDGTLKGPDLNLIKILSSEISTPLIAQGGISCLSDVKAAVDSGASAVAAGSFFVFYGPHRAVLITYPEYKELVSLFKY